jgi:hypothetical protein
VSFWRAPRKYGTSAPLKMSPQTRTLTPNPKRRTNPNQTVYQNCCDNGERMPSYYLQTLGGGSFTTDWAFPSAPDMLLINLGTNDFGRDAGPAWEANFTATYVEFVLNATARYKAPKLPVFVAQGPMNNGAPLYNALQAAIKGINEAGGNAFYLVRH